MKALKKLSEWLSNKGLESEALCAIQLYKIAEEKVFYKVKSGDILGRIAERYDVTEEQIVAENPGLDPARLSIGQRILIPPSKTSFMYKVEQGDTLGAIAEEHGISLQDILDENEDLTSSSTLSIGQALRLPYAASLEEKRRQAEEKHIRKWSGSEKDLIAMTLLGEGGTFVDTGDETMREVYTVIQNRMKHTGGSVKDIVFAPGQFEFWMKYDPNEIYSGSEWGSQHPRWSKAMEVVERKEIHPKVSFSTHYWNPRLVSPSWQDKIIVLHESKHVYGVLPDGSTLFKKVFKENKDSIKSAIKQRRFYNYSEKTEEWLKEQDWLSKLLGE